MSEELPAEVQGWIGEERYVEKTEFPIEMGYVYTTCSSVEMANPLYWDEKVAQELTGWADCAAQHDLGLVPSAQLGAESR